MCDTIDKLGRDFIENELHFSFSTLADKKMANLMLKCIEYGAELQNNLSTEKDVVELVEYFTKQLSEINENLPIMKTYDIPCALGGLESVVNLKFKNIYEK